ncbi:MAG: lysophospholipid acyltransferase family protein [Kiritimatiellaeota bacterium]|nr:lysophospholipid acyltransferase family protein [Kiritimatiellota bacterium]
MFLSAPMLGWLVKVISRRLARLSRPALLRWGAGLGWFFGRVIRFRRAEALAALRRSLPELSPVAAIATLDGMYRNLVLNLLEVLRMYGGATEEPETLMTIEGEDIVKAALARGRGAMILTAHLGNFDMLAMFAAHRHYPLTIVSKKLKNVAVNQIWSSLRERFGVNILFVHNAARGCLKALRTNGLVGFLLDQNRPLYQGVFVQFFGRPASTSPGLAVLAAQAQAPVIPIFISRRPDGTHHLQILPEIAPPPDREPATILRYTQIYTTVIERAIRQHPDQWTWIHRRWKNQPLPGDAIATPESSVVSGLV